jgi:hypothetical protein
MSDTTVREACEKLCEDGFFMCVFS